MYTILHCYYKRKHSFGLTINKTLLKSTNHCEHQEQYENKKKTKAPD